MSIWEVGVVATRSSTSAMYASGFTLLATQHTLAMCFGDGSVAEALDLEPVLLERWAHHYCEEAVADVRRTEAGVAERVPGFVEVGDALAAALSPTKSGSAELTVEVIKPCGTTVRVRGRLDTGVLEALVRAAGAWAGVQVA